MSKTSAKLKRQRGSEIRSQVKSFQPNDVVEEGGGGTLDE